MATITNTDTRAARIAEIVTGSANELNWCIATWAAPEYGHTEVTGEGHGWQIVRKNANGSYTYNTSMMGGFRNSLQDVKDMAAAKGYIVL